ncbi:serine protease [Brevibacillus sp. H7]|uniref:serine protease n=1 Tax=Brevibacillus sp. H7 TaxID=3349138 RepID=UPI0038058D07
MSWLDSIYLICIGVGLVYTFVTLFLGDAASDWLNHAHLPVLQPVLWVSGLTAFGGAGFLLSRLTSYSPLTSLALAAIGGVALAIAAYFIWVEPMSDAEASTGYSMQQLVGRVGEVWTTIPEKGFGEVLISMVSGTTHHMAASLTREPIREGTRVLVVEVREHVLYVTPLPNQGERESLHDAE